MDFLERIAIVNLPDEMTEELAQAAATIARAEGLTAHARSVERRLQGR
ncbi:MAG: histidinol dehydrogenase [Dehalococcoidia bacterium]|nr:histidinol dehydrogenase [Dehalococcoidia bacterium]